MTMGDIIRRINASLSRPLQARAYPRRHPLSKEECAQLKHLIRTRLKKENYRCRLPDARCYLRDEAASYFKHKRKKPVYRLRLRTETLRIRLTGGVHWFIPKQKVWR